jgi:hypothetical protein
MTDTELNTALAMAEGYTYAGHFRGEVRMFPPGQRTTSVPCPQYTTDWNALMPVLLRVWWQMEASLVALLGLREAQRAVCEAVLTTLTREG